MELEVTQLYADKTWVQVGVGLNGQLRRDLLQAGKEYVESLAIPQLIGTLEKTSNGGFLSWGANKALVVRAELKPYFYQGVFTLNSFQDTCVLGTYKLLQGDSFFAVNQSAEVRRRAVVDKLRHVETLDYFFMVDKVLDMVGEFLQGLVKELVKETVNESVKEVLSSPV
jgi:hypothetical protein